jgi:PKD domain
MHRFQTPYISLAAAVLAMSTAAQEVGSHYTFNGLQGALGNSVSGVDFITSHTEIGGHFQVSVKAALTAGFPTEGESFLVVSSGDSRINPGQNSNHPFDGVCVGDPLYSDLCNVGGVGVNIALPAQATSLWLDYKYWSWDGDGFLDPFRIYLDSSSGTSLVVQVDSFTEIGDKPAGVLQFGPLRSLMLDVTAYAGQTVTLRFVASDNFDLLYDSGALIDNLQVVVTANSPPVADAGPDQLVDCTSPDGADVTLDGTQSFDPDGDMLTYVWSAPAGIDFDDPTSATPTATFPIGVTVVTLTVSDEAETATDTVEITVIDDELPTVAIATSLGSVWPPNHRIEAVGFSITASDNCTDPGALELQSVTASSSESDDSTGDGAFVGDVAGADGFTAEVDVTSSFSWNGTTGAFEGAIDLRAERAGTGGGRTYTITATVADGSGNATTVTTTVVVPHSRGKQ